MKNTNRAKTHRQTLITAYRVTTILFLIAITLITSISLAGKPQGATATATDATPATPVAPVVPAVASPTASPAATETPRVLSKEDIRYLLVNGANYGSGEIWEVVSEYGRSIFRIAANSPESISFNWLDDAVLDKIVDKAYQDTNGNICLVDFYIGKSTGVVLTSLEDNILHGMYFHLDYAPDVFPVEFDLGYLTKGYDFEGGYGLGFVEEYVNKYPGQICADVTEFEFHDGDTMIRGALRVKLQTHS